MKYGIGDGNPKTIPADPYINLAALGHDREGLNNTVKLNNSCSTSSTHAFSFPISLPCKRLIPPKLWNTYCVQTHKSTSCLQKIAEKSSLCVFKPCRKTSTGSVEPTRFQNKEINNYCLGKAYWTHEDRFRKKELYVLHSSRHKRTFDSFEPNYHQCVG